MWILRWSGFRRMSEGSKSSADKAGADKAGDFPSCYFVSFVV
jgi:hypothetical protein